MMIKTTAALLALAMTIEGLSFVASSPRSRLSVQSNKIDHTVPYERRRTATMLTMRDHSASNWFSKGDRVKVMEDISKASYSLKGRTGIVVEAWEKGDVDDTCCCAEIHQELAIRVEFQGTEADPKEPNASFQFHFKEEELEGVKDEPVAFDGMSCMAFKLEQLEAQRNFAATAAAQSSEDGQC